MVVAQFCCIWFNPVVRIAQCCLSINFTGPLPEAMVSSLRMRPSMQVVVNSPPPWLVNTASVVASAGSGCHRLAKFSMRRSLVGPSAIITTAPMGRLILMLQHNQERKLTTGPMWFPPCDPADLGCRYHCISCSLWAAVGAVGIAVKLSKERSTCLAVGVASPHV